MLSAKDERGLGVGMKRQFLLVIILILLLGMVGCGKNSLSAANATLQPSAATAAQENPVEETALPEAAKAMPAEQQEALIMANYDLWAYTEPWDSPWFYTFTDLDHNGRLEVIAAVTQGTGVYTYVHCYEVRADGLGIENCYHRDVEIEGPDDWPEMIRESLPCYYDVSTDIYYYPCEGVTRDGVAHQYYSWSVLCLKDGTAEWEFLASKWMDWDDQGNLQTVCKDAAGNPISEQEYDSIVERRLAGMEKMELALAWTMVENPWPEVTEEETAAVPEAPQIVITKNPTREALAIGGKTWFIAHADNADSLTWRLVSPDGTIFYSLDSAMDIHPGLKLEALEGDTLAVSNVPLSLNGWAVAALFENAGGSVATEPAYLYVGDFITAYSSVITAYREAYSAWENKFEYAMEHGLSEVVRYSDSVGYALKDLDKNGIPELIIEGIGTDDFSGDIAYGIYTLSDGNPVELATSWARNRYYILTDNTILNEGSSGAGFSNYSTFRLDGQMLVPVKSVMTYFPGNDADGYYQQNGTFSYEPQPGDQKISAEAFAAAVDEFDSRKYTPPLTAIK